MRDRLGNGRDEDTYIPPVKHDSIDEGVLEKLYVIPWGRWKMTKLQIAEASKVSLALFVALPWPGPSNASASRNAYDSAFRSAPSRPAASMVSLTAFALASCSLCFFVLYVPSFFLRSS